MPAAAAAAAPAAATAAAPSTTAAAAAAPAAAAARLFACSSCDATFASGQALGGHRGVHRVRVEGEPAPKRRRDAAAAKPSKRAAWKCWRCGQLAHGFKRGGGFRKREWFGW